MLRQSARNQLAAAAETTVRHLRSLRDERVTAGLVPGAAGTALVMLDLERLAAPVLRARAEVMASLAALLLIVSSALMILLLRARGRRAELERRMLAEKYSCLARYANESVVVVNDATLRVADANDRALAIYGYTREEMLTRTVHDLRAPEAPCWIEEMRARMAAGGVVESIHRRKDGSTFPIEISARLIECGGARVWLTVSRDVTERRRAAREMEAALAAAREATELKSQFLATMSHEIRTPIHGILGMTELLLCSRLDNEQREYADGARRSAQGLLAIVNDILDLSKIEAGKLELENVVFDLWTVAEEVASLLAFKASGKNLEMACLIEPGVPRLARGDPARLRQVLTNLAGNAVKFTERGEVRITVQKAGADGARATIRFLVSDTGIGIPAGQRSRLFQSFTQGDPSTTRRYGGTGLGLAISRHLVERMGGTIDFESRPGKGTTFRFTVVLEEHPAPVADTGDPLSGAYVLVVDDNPTARMVVCRYLHSWGCRSAEAGDSDAALALMRDRAEAGDPFSAVIIDLRLGAEDGAALGRSIRRERGLGNPALLATGPIGMFAGSVLEIGFDAWVPKPVRQSWLYGRLVEALHRSEPEARGERHVARRRPTTGRRVLVAEDNEVNQKIVVRLLERLGCDAARVSNGREALDAVRREPWDLVLMDVQMPEMDGISTTNAIRSLNTEAGRVPIAAMTANAMTGDREACLSAGMDDYISKPVRLDDLERMITRWLGTRESS